MDEFTPAIVSILDEEGNEHLFEELDRIETENGKYVALLPYSESEEDLSDEDNELIILKVIEDNNEFYLEPIENDKEFNEVGEIFEERLSEMFLFEEEAE